MVKPGSIPGKSPAKNLDRRSALLTAEFAVDQRLRPARRFSLPTGERGVSVDRVCGAARRFRRRGRPNAPRLIERRNSGLMFLFVDPEIHSADDLAIDVTGQRKFRLGAIG
jgi:hypothetical protein